MKVIDSAVVRSIIFVFIHQYCMVDVINKLNINKLK